MSILEKHALGNQFVEIGSFRLRMPAHNADPVVQIVDGEKEDVRSFGERVRICESYTSSDYCKPKDSFKSAEER